MGRQEQGDVFLRFEIRSPRALRGLPRRLLGHRHLRGHAGCVPAQTQECPSTSGMWVRFPAFHEPQPRAHAPRRATSQRRAASWRQNDRGGPSPAGTIPRASASSAPPRRQVVPGRAPGGPQSPAWASRRAAGLFRGKCRLSREFRHRLLRPEEAAALRPHFRVRHLIAAISPAGGG